MSLYSVLLVDDEEDVFQIMIKKLNWEEMGFSIAGYARNGVEALEMSQELQPDVVMTDIKMPYMDGLTLCRKLKEQYEKIKVIIFSGFDEFEYAKEAIKIEAEEYILKPINSTELKDVFERIRINLDKELDEKQNIDKLKAHYDESLPIIQDNFFTLLLDGRIPENQIKRYALDYQIDLTGPYYIATVFHLSGEEVSSNQVSPFLKTVSVQKLLEEQFLASWNGRALIYLGDIIVVTQLAHVEDTSRYTDACNRLCQTARRVCKATVTAGIGNVCSEPSQLSYSYQGARNALSYRSFYGRGGAINISEADEKDLSDISWEAPYIEDIIKKTKMGKEEELSSAIHLFIEKIKDSQVSMQKYQMLVMESITELYRMGNDYRLNYDQLFNGGFYGQVMEIESADELGKWLLLSCMKIREQIMLQRQDTTQSFVDKAIQYVNDNFGDKELGVESVCEYLNVSTAYFSTVFKKATGKTFINYLTDFRMEKALKMLMEENEKTYVIADTVGYQDPNYFSYVFKKQFGMSPSKYKADRQ